MHLSGHVYRRMRWFEKLRMYVFRKRYTKALGKLNRAISDKDIQRACKYEELMYECDNRVEDYIHEMTMKYVLRDSRVALNRYKTHALPRDGVDFPVVHVRVHPPVPFDEFVPLEVPPPEV